MGTKYKLQEQLRWAKAGQKVITESRSATNDFTKKAIKRRSIFITRLSQELLDLELKKILT